MITTRRHTALLCCSIIATLLAVSCARKRHPPQASSPGDWHSCFQTMTHAIKIGMTKAQVTKAIGEPDLQEDIEHKGIREVWKYDLEPAIRFQVNFDAKGRVVGQQLDAPKFIEDRSHNNWLHSTSRYPRASRLSPVAPRTTRLSSAWRCDFEDLVVVAGVLDG